MGRDTATRDALAARLARYDRLVEVGVGRRPDVAAALAAAGKSVTATDVYDRPVPDGVRFVRDDVVARSEREDPGERYRVDAVYALNLPPELHRPTRRVARAAGADFLFTTLGHDEPTVPVRREAVGRETLFVALDGRSGNRRRR
ncbi:UPF0146 family protein [Halegenticoccus tardaugens]|uniref:UPF0146 family protein n=1 Tax=Halegenticoccus tardaugens TaxID=2071624 RepID=UPI00100AE10A|nr:UPF0146 family protein [Halegenticoccus tardaugens]